MSEQKMREALVAFTEAWESCWHLVDTSSEIHSLGKAAKLAREALSQREEQEPVITVRYDLQPAFVESAIRDKLINMGWSPPDAPSREVPDTQND